MSSSPLPTQQQQGGKGHRLTFVIAYSGTGKDTLYRSATSGAGVVLRPAGDVKEDRLAAAAAAAAEPGRDRLIVCAAPPADARPPAPPRLPKTMLRRAYADTLKQRVAALVPEMKGRDWREFESVKNTFLVTDPATGEKRPLRAVYISEGKRIREREGDDVFVMDALRPFLTTGESNSGDRNSDEDVMNTDTRFWIEVKTCEKHFPPERLDSIRIVAPEKDVPVAPVTGNGYDPEHTLDAYKTKFLILRWPRNSSASSVEAVFDEALRRFPQYTGYRPYWEIICAQPEGTDKDAESRGIKRPADSDAEALSRPPQKRLKMSDE